MCALSLFARAGCQTYVYGGISGHGVTSSVRAAGLCAWWGLGERGADLCVEDVSLRVRGVRLCAHGGV